MKSPTALIALVLAVLSPAQAATRQMERLDRGLVALPTSSSEVFLSWRLLGTEALSTSFDVYRSTDGAEPVKLNASPLEAGTCFTDTAANTAVVSEYTVQLHGSADGTEGRSVTLAANTPVRPYLPIPLNIPAGLTMPDSSTCTYSANDCSVGDLDGDGRYEIIVKWDPSNSKDNSHSGYSGNVYLDAYTLEGRQLWRIDLGRNIRAGAHYTQFMVYDLDGDGRAEVACRTSDGSIDGTGKVIGDGAADYRNSSGYILQGPEYLSIFNGWTGAEITRVDYAPTRVPSGTLTPTKTEIKAVWGDDYGNRIDRFLACIAYLDGVKPSLVMCRGYYTRSVLVAYDLNNGNLTKRWTFDTREGTYSDYAGQGNHNLSVADVDGDGKDEIVYGACTIDDNGTGLHNTNLRHGDALHVSDIVPARPGLEVWSCFEDYKNNGGIGLALRDAKTGSVLFSIPAAKDIGRACSGDIDPNYPGMECWGGTGGLYAADGTQITTTRPAMNFMCWWDGDLTRELLDGNYIGKWNPSSRNTTILVQDANCSSNNSTKATPCLSGDILGDWREEVIWRTLDSSELRLYTTTIPTEHRFRTLVHDSQYRAALAWQNVAYNQPPHPSFFLGQGMASPAAPDITTDIDTSGGRIVNLSTRARTGKDLEKIVVGFWASGDMRALVRAVGPSLAAFSVPSFATDTRLDLYQGSTLKESNDDWGLHSTPGDLNSLMARCYAFSIDQGSKDASLMPEITHAGYTAEATSTSDTEGVALVEIYADPQSSQGRLVNVSTRARCGTDFNKVVAGFYVSGSTPRRVLIRAIGPGLLPYMGAEAPVLANPRIRLFKDQLLVATNDDWNQGPTTSADFNQAYAFPLANDSVDAALSLTLQPGSYTAEIDGSDGGEGIVLAEIYDLE